MEPFEDDGVFWLPNDPSRSVSGHVAFDGESISLTVDGSLRHPGTTAEGEIEHRAPTWVIEPVVLGRLRTTGEVTLLNAGSFVFQSIFGDSNQETWTASIALLGAAVPEPMFGSASFSFDVLVPWAKPPSLVDWDSPQTGKLDLAKRTLDEVVIGEASVRLTSSWYGSAGGDDLSVRRRCWIAVTDVPPLSVSDFLNEWVRPVQNLLIVLLGRPVRLIAFSVVSERVSEPGSISGEAKQLKVVLGDLLVAPSPEASWSNLRNWGAPTMFVREELPISFGELLRGWVSVQARFGEAVTLLCSPFYAPFMYSEHRYASTFQSAESLAQAKYVVRELPPSDHRARVRSIVDAAQVGDVLPEHVAWAERILMGRNDKPLKQLIEELLADLGTLGRMVLEQDSTFARTAAAARARVSHPGGAGGLSTAQRHWYGEALSWLVRAALAVEAGLPLDAVVERVIQHGNFEQVVEKLRGT